MRYLGWEYCLNKKCKGRASWMPVENVTIQMYLGMVYGNNVRAAVKYMKGKRVVCQTIL